MSPITRWRPEGEAIWNLGSKSPDGLHGGGETLVYLGQGPHSHTLNGLSCQPWTEWEATVLSLQSGRVAILGLNPGLSEPFSLTQHMGGDETTLLRDETKR